ncbi:hypothetical protein [Shewanella sp. FJAT-52076]|uniref:hypothetical protein n=1 Tax=Shewanella sp. FJAT-52076 TaxID=2864202 RepID=UPI001C654C39|nr:hypothetical protein [Shewanella sp. FJAT-52076]QYJ74871.1 hypothetical protein K0H79_16225 [Shewanella sp. FJAT-52076]
MNLLTGEYDKFKRIERQKNNGQILRKVAYRLAYLMHTQKIREINKDRAIKILSNEFGSRYDNHLIESIIDDLIDPCNIMIVDRYSSTLSFGHFRFQEHLAAKELTQNRGVEIAELTRSDWWRGTLCLYAQDTDIEFLINEVYLKYNSIIQSEITLMEMAKNTPHHRRLLIEDMIAKTIKMDLFDVAIDGAFDSSSYDENYAYDDHLDYNYY